MPLGAPVVITLLIPLLSYEIMYFVFNTAFLFLLVFTKLDCLFPYIAICYVAIFSFCTKKVVSFGKLLFVSNRSSRGPQ